jgi:hypothetical protein
MLTLVDRAVSAVGVLFAVGRGVSAGGRNVAIALIVTNASNANTIMPSRHPPPISRMRFWRPLGGGVLGVLGGGDNFPAGGVLGGGDNFPAGGVLGGVGNLAVAWFCEPTGVGVVPVGGSKPAVGTAGGV